MDNENIIKLQQSEIQMNKQETLSKVQKFVCSMFKITPQQKYDCVITIYPTREYIRIGDLIVVNEMSEQFYVFESGIGQHGKMFRARSLKLLIQKPFIRREVIVFGNAYPEGQDKPRG